MGLRQKITFKRVYVDTNILIYLFEGFKQYAQPIQVIADCVDARDSVLLTGEITLAEILVAPFKQNNLQAVSAYSKALNDRQFIQLIPTSRKIYTKTAFLRASLPQMKTPDAIHMASAIEGGADMFLTNDKKLKTPREIERILLDDFV